MMDTTMEKTEDRDYLYAAWSDDRKTAHPHPLKDWISRHPEYRADLVQWAADDPVMERAEMLPSDPEGEARTLAIGLQVVAEMRARYETALPGLLTTARKRGLSTADLADRLALSEPLVLKLERRLIRAASLPGALIERLAEALQVGAHQVRNYLSQPPTLAASASYKADRAPQATRQQEFAQAVRNCSEMTAEQKDFWLSKEG